MLSPLPLPPAPNPKWAWFFDIDGTLIELASEPASLDVGHSLPALLEALYERTGGALALVSGRSLDNIQKLIAPFRLPMSGCHGIERMLADGSILRPAAAPEIAAARERLSQFAEAHPGTVLEDKGLALAIHFREVPHLAADCKAVIEEVAVGSLGWFSGKMVYEVKPKAYDKGYAIKAFLEMEPFRGRTPVFLGDDQPDEFGFAAVRSLGGVAVLVGAPRPTRASHRLDSVSAVHAWLNRL